jgi:hypothetical protein
LRLDFYCEWSVGRNIKRVPKTSAQLVSPEAVATEITELAKLPLGKLKAVWVSEFGRDPPKRMWRDLLLWTLAWRLQEKAFGGHDKATQRLLEACGQKRTGDLRCRRLKPGTVLIRDFEGARHTVTTVPGGFVWQEKTYPSLTAIAKSITGTNWNGPRFFGLRERQGQKDSVPQKTVA